MTRPFSTLLIACCLAQAAGTSAPAQTPAQAPAQTPAQLPGKTPAQTGAPAVAPGSGALPAQQAAPPAGPIPPRDPRLVPPRVRDTTVPPEPVIPLPPAGAIPAGVPLRPLTADEAARIALRLQPNIDIARANIDIQRGLTRQTRSNLLPQLTITGSYTFVQNLTHAGRGGAVGGATGTGTGGTGTGTTGTGTTGTGTTGTGTGTTGTGTTGTGTGSTGTGGSGSTGTGSTGTSSTGTGTSGTGTSGSSGSTGTSTSGTGTGSTGTTGTGGTGTTGTGSTGTTGTGGTGTGGTGTTGTGTTGTGTTGTGGTGTTGSGGTGSTGTTGTGGTTTTPGTGSQGSAGGTTTTGAGSTGTPSSGVTNTGTSAAASSAGASSLLFQGFVAEATLRQLIYDFNHTLDLVRQSVQLERAAAQNLTRTQNDTVLDVKQAFYLLVQNLQQVQVDELEVTNRQSQLDLAQARFNVGLGLPSDIITAQTAKAEAILALSQARANAEQARINLALLMGIDPRTPLQPAEATEPPVISNDVNALTQTALTRRPEVLQAQYTLRSAQYGVSAARTTNAPSIAGTASVISRGDQFLPQENDLTVGVGITWTPIDGGLTRGRVQSARGSEQIARQQLRAAQLTVTSDVAVAYVNLRSTETRVAIAIADVANAEEGVRIATGRYSTGLGLFLDIINAQAFLLTARTNLVNTQNAVEQYRAALQHAIGYPIPAVQ